MLARDRLPASSGRPASLTCAVDSDALRSKVSLRRPPPGAAEGGVGGRRKPGGKDRLRRAFSTRCIYPFFAFLPCHRAPLPFRMSLLYFSTTIHRPSTRGQTARLGVRLTWAGIFHLRSRSQPNKKPYQTNFFSRFFLATAHPSPLRMVLLFFSTTVNAPANHQRPDPVSAARSPARPCAAPRRFPWYRAARAQWPPG